ncbi:hypothetical protein ACSQ67_013271 [Phaseolus vulgaris]
MTSHNTKHTVQINLTQNGRLRLIPMLLYALFIEYKASSLTLSHETLPLLLFAASAFAPPPNQFLCKSRFVFARCVSITTSAICVFL